MMWNGAFGALLFINDLEYLGSSNACVLIVHPFRIAIKARQRTDPFARANLLRSPQRLFHEHDSPTVGRVA